MKTCAMCQEVKSFTSFSKDSKRKDKLNPYCKMCVKERYEKNKVEILTKKRLYYSSNKENLLKKFKAYYADNRSEMLTQKAEYYLANKERMQRYNAVYRKLRRSYDVNFKLQCNLRSRLNAALKKNFKAGSSVTDLGCSIEELKVYLESKFQPGMSWENHGKWHLDHIKPLSSFDLTDEEQLKSAVHFSNLQPLWAKDNLKKYVKY
jgi:hypothetical protein